jgi:UDP-glucose 4-epimerase
LSKEITLRVLVTGAYGKVGRAAVTCLQHAGHAVTASDLTPPKWNRPPEGEAPYVKAELTDAGQVYALVGGISEGQNAKTGRYDAVVHCGAIPAPGKHAPHEVFANNMLGAFNIVEACVRWGVPRLVNISSETAPGFVFAEREAYPAYLPVDEEHPLEPEDPYALAKVFGEQLCDAAARRSSLRTVTIRPSWVQDEHSYARNLGPMLADKTIPSINGWAYVDAYDLGDAIVAAVVSDLPGHEVFYIAAPDTVGGRALHAAWRAAFPDAPTELRPVSRVDASGISTAKAQRLLGWQASRTWRDYLTETGERLG